MSSRPLLTHITVSGPLHEAVLPKVKELESLTCTGCLIGEWWSPDCENSFRLESPCDCRCCNIDGPPSWRRPCRMQNAGPQCSQMCCQTGCGTDSSAFVVHLAPKQRKYRQIVSIMTNIFVLIYT